MKTENVVHVRFKSMLPIGPKHVQAISDDSDFNVELVEGGVVRISQRVKSDDPAIEAIEHATYVPLANVEYLRCEPVKIPRKRLLTSRPGAELKINREAFLEGAKPEAAPPAAEPVPETTSPAAAPSVDAELAAALNLPPEALQEKPVEKAPKPAKNKKGGAKK